MRRHKNDLVRKGSAYYLLLDVHGGVRSEKGSSWSGASCYFLLVWGFLLFFREKVTCVFSSVMWVTYERNTQV